MDAPESNEGVDSETACRIEVTVTAYFSVIDGRTEYQKGRTFGWTVDSEEYAIVELVKDVQAYYHWADYQDAEFWYVGEGGQSTKLCNDAELLSLLRASNIVKFDMIVDGEKHGNDTQAVLFTGREERIAFVDDQEQGQGNDLVEDPLFGPTVAGPARVDEEEAEHDMIEGVDPDGDEPAGADEEWRYFKKKSKKVADKETQKAAGKALSQNEVMPSQPDHDSDCVPSDEAVVVASSYVATTTYDRDNPAIVEGSTFTDKDAFLMLFKQFCIQNEFETELKHSDPERYRARCKDASCDWKIYAKKVLSCETFRVVNIGPTHTCTSTSQLTGKLATATWIADRVKGMLMANSGLGAKELKERLEHQFNITLTYNKVWEGRRCALKELHGTWEDSFKLLWNFKAAVEATCPGSIVEIGCKKVKGKMYFSRMFVALRPCVDGFLMGCRPYLGVDATHLTGKYNGQLAAVTAIDGHNWMYPVAYGIFGKETKGNWKWFMTQLKRAIGTPLGLTIHTDACKGLEYAVGNIFGGAAEHRECFRHLMANFRKKFKGDVLKYMWPSAWACTPGRHQKLMDKIAAASPEAIIFLKTFHIHLWSRAQFSKICKVDYVNNNISECFNNWIKDLKDLPVVDLMDMIRVKIMEKIATRQTIANDMQGLILKNVVNDLNQKSRNLHYNITKSGFMKAEISGVSKNGYAWRFAVNLTNHTCSCGQWEVSGKPCYHAIAYITSLRGTPIKNYVHEYYSVQRFKDTYQFEVNPMGDKSQWPTLEPGFDMRPPKLERSAGRPKKKRIKSSGEPGKRGPYQCHRCFQFGHIEKGCKNAVVEPDEDLPEPPATKKKKAKCTTAQGDTHVAKKPSRKKKGDASQDSTSHPPPSSPSSPGPITRKRAAMTPPCASPSGITQEATPSRIKRRLLN